VIFKAWFPTKALLTAWSDNREPAVVLFSYTSTCQQLGVEPWA
jgi:hypothetical protein